MSDYLLRQHAQLHIPANCWYHYQRCMTSLSITKRWAGSGTLQSMMDGRTHRWTTRKHNAPSVNDRAGHNNNSDVTGISLFLLFSAHATNKCPTLYQSQIREISICCHVSNTFLAWKQDTIISHHQFEILFFNGFSPKYQEFLTQIN
jgi:hypothetical protein